MIPQFPHPFLNREITVITVISRKGKGRHRGLLLLHFFRGGCSSDACVPGQPEDGFQGDPAAVRSQAVGVLLAGFGLGIAGIEAAGRLGCMAKGQTKSCPTPDPGHFYTQAEYSHLRLPVTKLIRTFHIPDLLCC